MITSYVMRARDITDVRTMNRLIGALARLYTAGRNQIWVRLTFGTTVLHVYARRLISAAPCSPVRLGLMMEWKPASVIIGTCVLSLSSFLDNKFT